MEAWPQAPAEGLALRMLGPDRQVLARGEQADQGGLLLSATIDHPGLHLLHVHAQERVFLDLTIQAEAAEHAEALACLHALPLVAGQPLPLLPHLPSGRFRPGCGQGQGSEHVAWFELSRGSLVSLQVVGDRLESTIALRRDCAEPASERACNTGEEARLDDLVLEPGAWFVLVATGGGMLPELLLDLREECEADLSCPGGRVCEGGFCREPCLSDEDCQGAQSCNRATGACEEPELCLADQDCLDPRVCELGECILSDCEQNDDCEGVCVDRRCAARDPAACGPGATCPGEQVCAPPGACLLDRPCARDEDCPPQTPRCDLFTGSCMVCLQDRECAAAEYCWEGACSFEGSCIEDEDCPGSRLCQEESLCLPAQGCPGDRFDLRPDPVQLVPRTYTSLLLCDGSEDLFRISLPSRRGLVVVLRHPPQEGDLSLALRGPGGWPLLAHSDLHVGLERACLNPGPEEREVEILVRGRAGFVVSYSLSLELQGPGTCLPDEQEGLMGNDDPAHARPLGRMRSRTTICPGEDDWFSLFLPAGSRLSLDALPDSPAQGLRMTLLGLDGEPMAEARRQEQSLVVEAEIAQTGRYPLWLSSSDPEEQVGLELWPTIEALEDAQELGCNEARTLLPGEPLPLPHTLAADRFQLSCGAGEGADHVLRFELDQASTVSLRVRGDHFGTTLALRQGCEERDSEVACVFAEEPVLQGVLLDAGTWYVVVETGGGIQPELLLTLNR